MPPSSRRRLLGGLVVTGALVAASLTSAADSNAVASPRTFPKGIPPVAGSVARPATLTPAGASVDYHYVYDRSDDTATGAKARYVVADPAIAAGDSHSLAEIAVESADGNQIVEEGWTVDPGQFGDSLPHLFVFHWVDGVAGCYNGCHFVSTSTPSINDLPPLDPGSTHTFQIAYVDGNWTIDDDGHEIGYFPGTLWSGDFTEVGLTQWFGEVATVNSPSCALMGNGLPAADVAADSISGMKLVSGPLQFALTPTQTDPALYSGVATSGDSMRFGGPGGCATTPQAITFRSKPPTNASVGGASYQVKARGGTSGQPVLFGRAEAASSVCTVHKATVSFTATGHCVVVAAQPGSTTVLPSPEIQQRFAVRLPQTIAFTTTPPDPAHVGHRYHPDTQPGASGNPVTLSIAGKSKRVCRLASDTVRFVAHGTCVLRANETGNRTYVPAPHVTQRITVKH